MTGLPGGVFFVGVRGLAGAWRVLDGFLTGSWRVLGGFLAGANMRPKMAFAGWEGLAFERGGGGWMLGRLGLGVACYLSFCRLVLYAKPTTFAIVKTKATPPRGACYGINTNTHNHY